MSELTSWQKDFIKHLCHIFEVDTTNVDFDRITQEDYEKMTSGLVNFEKPKKGGY